MALRTIVAHCLHIPHPENGGTKLMSMGGLLKKWWQLHPDVWERVDQNG